MKLVNFNPEDGSFDHIANDDGSPAITFYQIGEHGTHFQLVTGADGSVNIDAKTPDGDVDVDIGLWPQQGAGVYIQSEVRSNWFKITPSDKDRPIYLHSGGAPYSHRVPVEFALQGAEPFAPHPASVPVSGHAEPASHAADDASGGPGRRSGIGGLRGRLIRLLGG